MLWLTRTHLPLFDYGQVVPPPIVIFELRKFSRPRCSVHVLCTNKGDSGFRHLRRACLVLSGKGLLYLASGYVYFAFIAAYLSIFWAPVSDLFGLKLHGYAQSLLDRFFFSGQKIIYTGFEEFTVYWSVIFLWPFVDRDVSFLGRILVISPHFDGVFLFLATIRTSEMPVFWEFRIFYWAKSDMSFYPGSAKMCVFTLILDPTWFV